MQTVYSQESINTSGGSASGSMGSSDYSIGQVFYSTKNDSGGTVYEGVQCPYEVSIITSIRKAKTISLQVEVFPNPATEYAKLKIDFKDCSGFKYEIYTIRGALVCKAKISDNLTNIPLTSYQPGEYLIRVYNRKKLYKTFKLIKQ